MISSNNFSKNQPNKSSNAFVSSKPTKSSNAFVSSKPTKNLDLPTGDNLSTGAVYGGDQATFGDLYGDAYYYGLSHFLKRTENTPTH